MRRNIRIRGGIGMRNVIPDIFYSLFPRSKCYFIADPEDLFFLYNIAPPLKDPTPMLQMLMQNSLFSLATNLFFGIQE